MIVSRSLLRKLSVQSGEPVDDETILLLTDNSKKLVKNRIIKIVSRREIATMEIFRRLRREGYNSNHIKSVLDQLKESGVVDDERFARSLIHDWTTVRPKGNNAIIRELKKNGLDPDDYTDLLKTRDEFRIALQFVRHKLDRGHGENEKKRIVRMLLYRGFSPDVVQSVVEEIGDELR